ncbi:MAG: alpha/beta hydrolase, partial [Dehalococcoidia bacterium]|nr:alpha/beta hydrolase [Dehalococcoidia bacterium]
MIRGYVDTALGQVHYREDGSGPPLVLLHQTADSSRQYTEVMPCLAERFRVVAFDTPGFGDSDKPAEPPSMAQYAEAIRQAMDGVGVGQTALLGHHTGASIAVEIAATYPDRVTALILSGCPDYDPDVRPAKIAGIVPMPIEPDGSHLLKAWERVNAGMRGWATLEQIN